MAKDLFSVPIFFIVFRETLEAAIIVSVLLGLAEQIVRDDRTLATNISTESDKQDVIPSEDQEIQRRRLIRKLRFQVRPFLSADGP